MPPPTPDRAVHAAHAPPLRGPRPWNERVVLQAIRQHGALPGAEIARLTHLTAQTVSTICKRLEAGGLLRRCERQRGKVGQPAVPLALNPDGAFAVGIKVGRRSVDVLLVDFAGAVRQRWSLAWRQPDPVALLAEIDARLAEIHAKLSPPERHRVQGVGIAAPFNLGGWQTLLEMPAELAAQWEHVDLRAEVARLTNWPVLLVKDTAAACVAELVSRRGHGASSFLYVYVDTFIGGALVLDGRLQAGLHGNAGALGSMALQQADGPSTPPQLLGVASLLNLERRFQGAGLDPTAVADDRALTSPWWPQTQAWLAEAAAAIALAVNGAVCLLDLQNVVVDGSFSRAVQGALLAAVNTALGHYSWEGVARPALLPGAIGPDARALGGALLPLHANFSPDHALFLKIAAA